jgi:non-ribosomal peptide synthetase component F
MSRSYASGGAARPLIGDTIGENLERAVARFGDREALVVRHQDLRLSYAELNERVDRLARGLLAVACPGGCFRQARWAIVSIDDMSSTRLRRRRLLRVGERSIVRRSCRRAR